MKNASRGREMKLPSKTKEKTLGDVLTVTEMDLLEKLYMAYHKSDLCSLKDCGLDEQYTRNLMYELDGFVADEGVRVQQEALRLQEIEKKLKEKLKELKGG